jgi:hypothetical protein
MNASKLRNTEIVLEIIETLLKTLSEAQNLGSLFHLHLLRMNLFRTCLQGLLLATR